MPAAFVKVTEAKRGMEGSDDEAKNIERQVIALSSDDDNLDDDGDDDDE